MAETNVTSSAFKPASNSQPANAKCQIPPVAVPDAVSCLGLLRMSASNSLSVCQGESVGTINAAASSFTDINGVESL